MARPEDPGRGRSFSRRQALAGGGVAALAGAAPSPTGAEAVQPCDAASTRIAVRTDRVVGSLPKFWRCTGFTPAELLLYPEMRQTLSFLGAIPNRGIEFVRVHFLLDLIGATRGGGRIAYDWTLLDEALETMLERGLRPFLELMGNPSRPLRRLRGHGPAARLARPRRGARLALRRALRARGGAKLVVRDLERARPAVLALERARVPELRRRLPDRPRRGRPEACVSAARAPP